MPARPQAPKPAEVPDTFEGDKELKRFRVGKGEAGGYIITDFSAERVIGGFSTKAALLDFLQTNLPE